MSETGTQLVKFGALALAIQNAIFLLGGFVAPGLVSYVLYIDLVGFLLLGIGYILHTQQGGADQRFMIAGGAIIVWVIARVLWQFVLTGALNIEGGGIPDANDFVDTLFNMIYAFLFSAIALLVAGYFLNKVAGTGKTLFFSFGIVNFIAVFLIVQPLIATNPDNFDSQVGGLFVGILMKIIVVPIIALITFFKIFSDTEGHLGMTEAM